MNKCITLIWVLGSAPVSMRRLVSMPRFIFQFSWCCLLRSPFSNSIEFDGIRAEGKSKPLEFEGFNYGEFAAIKTMPGWIHGSGCELVQGDIVLDVFGDERAVGLGHGSEVMIGSITA